MSAPLRRQPFIAFCERVLGLRLSPAWRVLLRVAVDGVEPVSLEGDEREVARVLFGDINVIPESVRRVLVWRLGRGSGKTTISSALGLWEALTADLSNVGPGMLAAAVVVAPTKKTATIAVSVARELVRSVPALERLIDKKGDTDGGFTLRRSDGRSSSFMAVAASRGGASLRGFDLLALVLDESEFFASNDDVAAADGYAVSDRDLYAAAKPRLRGRAIFISTPWPSPNLTDELFTRNFGAPVDALCAAGASTMMRPTDTRLAADVELELLRDEDNARREYFVRSRSARWLAPLRPRTRRRRGGRGPACGPRGALRRGPWVRGRLGT